MTENRPRPLLDELTAPIQQLARGIGGWAKRNPQAFETILWALAEISTPRPGEEIEMGGAERFMRRVLPANWLDERIGLQNAARRTMAETGICLAWVPRSEVIVAIVQAKDQEQRDEALVTNEAEILDDLEAVVAEVSTPQLLDLAESARQSVAAYRADLHQPAQALAGAGITTVLADHFGEDNFAEARERLTPPSSENVDVRVARRAMLEWCLLTAIALSYTEPAPPGFNRHLTAHEVGPKQYTDANALAGLLLFVGLLRELHEVYAISDHGIPVRLRERITSTS